VTNTFLRHRSPGTGALAPCACKSMGVPKKRLPPPPAARSKSTVTKHPPPPQHKTNPTKAQPSLAGFSLLEEGEKTNSMSARCWLMNWKVPREQHPAGVTPEDLCKCEKPQVWAFSRQTMKRNFEVFRNKRPCYALQKTAPCLLVRGIYFFPSCPLRGAKMLQSQPGWCQKFILGQFTWRGKSDSCVVFPFSLQLCFAAA